MRKIAAAALAAGALGTMFTATPASAACVTFSSEWYTVASVPTPYGPAEVNAPGQTEVDPGRCRQMLVEIFEAVQI